MALIDKLIHPLRTSSSPAGRDDFRRAARELALQFLYQLIAQNGANLDQLDQFLDEYCPLPQARPLAAQWTRGAWQQRAEMDRLIRRVSANWDLSRISMVDLSNLYLALYQLLHCPEIPPKAVLNEAVELAKTFSTAQAPAFINGVLDALRKELSPPPPEPKNKPG